MCLRDVPASFYPLKDPNSSAPPPQYLKRACRSLLVCISKRLLELISFTSVKASSYSLTQVSTTHSRVIFVSRAQFPKIDKLGNIPLSPNPRSLPNAHPFSFHPTRPRMSQIDWRENVLYFGLSKNVFIAIMTSWNEMQTSSCIPPSFPV